MQAARTTAAGVLLTKGVVGSPANYLTPASLAATAEQLAAQFPATMSVKVLEREEKTERKLGVSSM